jgi:hypothetical protein
MESSLKTLQSSDLTEHKDLTAAKMECERARRENELLTKHHIAQKESHEAEVAHYKVCVCVLYHRI